MAHHDMMPQRERKKTLLHHCEIVVILSALEIKNITNQKDGVGVVPKK